uniref:Uncharacterized protein n=1 Tax=Coccidioides posadasii RMSCC 3488 TaxID=454284 RepID=A0A0J6I5H3_COCPO|nr:hypothetical protein CPAG_02955 [Coccidioides posadasii RMSCC 3488]
MAGVSTKVDKSTVNCMARGYMETQYPPFPQQYTPSWILPRRMCLNGQWSSIQIGTELWKS